MATFPSGDNGNSGAVQRCLKEFVCLRAVCVVNVQRDGMAKYQKEEEEKTLKAITLFCFPEGINWAPLTEYNRLASPSCIL